MTAMDIDIGSYLAMEKGKLPSGSPLAAYFSDFDTFYEQKLWHQLTVKLEEFVKLAEAKPLLVSLYDSFVSDFAKKMNQLSYVKISIVVSKLLPTPKEAIAFLETVCEKVKTELPAYVLARMETGHCRLLSGDWEGAKATVEECAKILDTLAGVDPVIHASFYIVASDYDKAKGNYASFYKNSLLYLACINLDDVAPAEKLQRAYDLGLAALLGETIYNFGELMLHPILECIKGTPHEWLGHLLMAFNSGNIDQFNAMNKEIQKMPLLVQNAAFLQQKICLMALIESVFNRPAGKRVLSFEDISKETRVSADEVEHLVMKALSLGLIKGSLDQIDGQVRVEWVQPRVLNKQQVEGIMSRVLEWRERVAGIATFVESETPELFVQ